MLFWRYDLARTWWFCVIELCADDICMLSCRYVACSLPPFEVLSLSRVLTKQIIKDQYADL